MKISDIVTLAKAGYTPKDVLKLLEVVETSPEVKKVDAVLDQETGDVSIKKQDEVPEPEVKPDEGTSDIDALVNLLKSKEE